MPIVTYTLDSSSSLTESDIDMIRKASSGNVILEEARPERRTSRKRKAKNPNPEKTEERTVSVKIPGKVMEKLQAAGVNIAEYLQSSVDTLASALAN